MQPTDLIDNLNLRDDIPDFGPGDTLKVHVKVIEGNRQRTQLFEGVVVRRQQWRSIPSMVWAIRSTAIAVDSGCPCKVKERDRDRRRCARRLR